MNVGDRERQRTFVVLAVGVSSFGMLQSLIVPVLPILQHELHTTQPHLTWVMTAYLLSAAVCTPLVGRIGDIVGKKRVFVLALLALAVGSLLGAVAPNLTVMLVARVVQGVAGGMMPLAFGIVRDVFPPDRITGAVAMLSSSTAVAGAVGIVAAGPLEHLLGYRSLFWIPMLITCACAIATQRVVRELPGQTGPRRVSLLPAVLLSTALVAFLLALTQGPEWGWTSASVLVLFIAAAVIAVGWVVSETRAAAPVIDMTMMRIRAVWSCNAVGFMVGMGLYGGSTFIPLFVQSPESLGYGFSATVMESGLIMLPHALLAFGGATLVSLAAARVEPRMLVALGSVTSASSMVLFALVHDTLVWVYVASALLGLGLAAAFSSMSALVVVSVPPEQTGVAGGMNANIRTVGGAVGIGIVTTVLAQSSAGTGRPSELGYTVGFAALGAALVLGAGLAFLIPRTRRPPRGPAVETPELGYLPGGPVAGAPEPR